MGLDAPEEAGTVAVAETGADDEVTVTGTEGNETWDDTVPPTEFTGAGSAEEGAGGLVRTSLADNGSLTVNGMSGPENGT